MLLMGAKQDRRVQ